MTLTIIGLDLSWTASALVVLHGHDPFIGAKCIFGTKPTCSRPTRLSAIRDHLIGYVRTWNPNCVVIEGYAMGARNGRELAGELGGVMRVALHDWDRMVPVIEVPPSTLKKFVTGRGIAEKNLMLREVYRKWSFSADDDNQADAYALAQFGFQWMRGEDAWTKSFAELASKVVDLSEPPQPKAKKGKAAA